MVSLSERTADSYVIGLDIGTSSAKAIAFDLEGQHIRSGRSAYQSLREADGVRQRPADWWTAVIVALAGAVTPGARCLGIAVAGQIGTYVAVDEHNQPLEDAWTWQDGSPSVVLEQLRGAVDLEAMAEDLGTWLPLGANWPLPRLLWLREHRPELLERLTRLAMTKDYVITRLTGEVATDPSTWRGLVDPQGALHQASMSTFGLPDVVAPRMPSTASAGVLLPEVAALIGMAGEVPVFLGSSDYACALLGTGVVDEGDWFDIGGTSEHIGALSTTRANEAGLCVVPYLPAAEPGSCVNYGVTSNGGTVPVWLGESLLPGVTPENRDAELTRMVESASPDKRPLFFLPFLNGERSPLWEADAFGAWIGLRADHRSEDLARAALEGVAFNMRHIREISPLAKSGQRIRATGGTARSALWNQIKADVLGAPLAVMSELDSAALGAAIYAAAGSGAYASLPEAIRAMTREDHLVEPRPQASGRYGEAYETYRQLVGALEPMMRSTFGGREPHV